MRVNRLGYHAKKQNFGHIWPKKGSVRRHPGSQNESCAGNAIFLDSLVGNNLMWDPQIFHEAHPGMSAELHATIDYNVLHVSEVLEHMVKYELSHLKGSE